MLTTAAASVTLSQSIQIAGFANQLSKNVSMMPETQEDVDVKMEHKLNVLYDVVQSRCKGMSSKAYKPESS